VLFTPAQYSGLPGMAFPAPADTYPTTRDVASYLQSYKSTFGLPVRANSRVPSLTRSNDEFLIATPDAHFGARQVVVATGPFQVPFTPGIAADFDETVFQVHSADYRNPAQIPGERALVVGGGNSGFQIADELQKTRKVDLSVARRMPLLPQRVLGRDIFWWLTRTGLINLNVETRLGRRMSLRAALIGSSPKKGPTVGSHREGSAFGRCGTTRRVR
jgi:putative flavoprotein involved in K+ transport